jgi:hypothetical protein
VPRIFNRVRMRRISLGFIPEVASCGRNMLLH